MNNKISQIHNLYSKFNSELFDYLKSEDFKKLNEEKLILLNKFVKDNYLVNETEIIQFREILIFEIENLNIILNKLEKFLRIIQNYFRDETEFKFLIDEISIILNYKFKINNKIFSKKISLEQLFNYKLYLFEKQEYQELFTLEKLLELQLEVLFNDLKKKSNPFLTSPILKFLIFGIFFVMIQGCSITKYDKINNFDNQLMKMQVETQVEIQYESEFGVEILSRDFNKIGGSWCYSIDYLLKTYYEDINLFKKYNVTKIIFASVEDKDLYVVDKDFIMCGGVLKSVGSNEKRLFLSPKMGSGQNRIESDKEVLFHEIAHLHHDSMSPGIKNKFESKWLNIGLGGFNIKSEKASKLYYEDIAYLVGNIGHFLYLYSRNDGLNSKYLFEELKVTNTEKIRNKIYLLIEYGFFPDRIKDKLIKILAK